MFTSAADVFRTRQVMSDLTACIAQSGRSAFCRITTRKTRLERLFIANGDDGGRFEFPRDLDVYGEVLLAAALPDDDFPAFTAATVLLLLDRLRDGVAEDDLYWNWDAFSDHYRMADPPVRAVIMNGFRAAAAAGRVSLSPPPEAGDCLTRSQAEVLVGLRRIGDGGLARAIEANVSPREAAVLWQRASGEALAPERLAGFRYLYERPDCLAPLDPGTAALIPWTI